MRNLLLQVLLLFFVSFQKDASAQSASDVQTYVQRFKSAALEQERLYGVPASITLAQGILESGAGKSALTVNANNHFGIKVSNGWSGKVYYAWDDEPQKSRFRWYDSAAESFRDHSLFLRNNSRYRSLFSLSVYDYRGWAFGLQRAGYATATNYAVALIGYIDLYRLYEVNGGVKLQSGKTVTITRTITREELIERDDIVADEAEKSDEEEMVQVAVRRFVAEINGVRCTVVNPGETLHTVCQRYDIPRKELLAFNETDKEEELLENGIVFLQEKKKKYGGAQDFYRVKDNESLYDVSQKFGVKMVSLAKMNGIAMYENLKEGCKLRLK